MFAYPNLGKETKADDKFQLTCTVKYKEVGPFGFWSKRFCVLCGPKLYVFSSSKPKGKPSTILDLARGVITQQVDKKHLFCVQVATTKKIVLLSFTTRLDQSVWLKKAEKVKDGSNTAVACLYMSMLLLLPLILVIGSDNAPT